MKGKIRGDGEGKRGRGKRGYEMEKKREREHEEQRGGRKREKEREEREGEERKRRWNSCSAPSRGERRRRRQRLGGNSWYDSAVQCHGIGRCHREKRFLFYASSPQFLDGEHKASGVTEWVMGRSASRIGLSRYLIMGGRPC